MPDHRIQLFKPEDNSDPLSGRLTILGAGVLEMLEDELARHIRHNDRPSTKKEEKSTITISVELLPNDRKYGCKVAVTSKLAPTKGISLDFFAKGSDENLTLLEFDPQQTEMDFARTKF